MTDLVGALFLLVLFLAAAVPWIIISPALTLFSFPFLVAIILLGGATLIAFALAFYSFLPARRPHRS